ncbi:MAG: APC family permease [Proteobacteria bacterium]|nr:APC family permease [Pseudomonadota bacterium]MBU1741028.1 APC family permease [Pseudomonadota bacterium]
MGDNPKETLGFWAVVAIGVGGMVGGGIFAVLGLAVVLAGGGTPVAFAIAGVVAALTSYSYAKLSVTFPSQGGTVTFLNQAFGPGWVTGSLNILLWASYVVTLSLYAYACGSYGATFFPEAWRPVMKHVILSGGIVVFTVVNCLGATAVGRSETLIVVVKMCILAFVAIFGLWTINWSGLAPSTWENPISLTAGGMIIFVAYEGFELIANTAHNTRDPARTLPRAYYTSVGAVVILYIVIAMVVVGNLPLDRIAAAKDYALAAAAQPFLGRFGFLLVAVAALLATLSAINATLFGSARISYIIARDGELPRELEKKIHGRPLEGLVLTGLLGLLMANFLDLSSISTMGSAGFLLIFAAVNLANVVLGRRTGSRRWLSGLGALVCVLALAALIWKTIDTAPQRIWILVGLVGGSTALELVYRALTGRHIRLTSTQSPGPAAPGVASPK